MQLDVVTYNLGNAPDSRVKKDLERLATLRGDVPRVIAGQEAGDRDRILPRPGWKVLQGRGDGTEKCVLLIHRSISTLATGYYHLANSRFVGACHGLPPYCDTKWIAWSRLKVGTRRVIVGSTHLVPGVQADCSSQARRRALYRDQTDGILDFEAARVPPCIVVGDFNCVPTETLLAPMHRYFNVRYDDSEGRPIDQHWFQPQTWLKAGRAKALDGYSSDHPPVLVTYTLTG